MNPALISELSNYPLARFKTSETIICQGTSIDHVYYLVKGSCKRILNTYDGKGIVLDYLDANGSINCFIGALSAYRDRNEYGSSFQAASPCELRKIPKNEFKALFRDNPDLMEEFLASVIKRYDSLKNNFASRQSGNTPASLCQLILDQSEDVGGSLRWNRQMTYEEIGRYIGVHRVTVSKMIAALVETGVLIRDFDSFAILNESALAKYSRSEMLLRYTD